MEYTVIRQHYGDKQYYQGDTRTIDDEHVAGRLISLGPITKQTQEKAESPVQNKAKSAPKNKAVSHDKDND